MSKMNLVSDHPTSSRPIQLPDPETVANLTKSPGLWLHRGACDTLSNAYTTGLKKLHNQLAHAQLFVSQTELMGGAASSVLELRRTIEDGKRFILNCKCSEEDLLLKKAISVGLSTEAVNTHLHDFLVAFCAVSDAIGHALERATTSHDPDARSVRESRCDNQLVRNPDLFWKQELASHILIIHREQLDKQIKDDLEVLEHKVNRSLVEGSSHNEDNVRQRVGRFLRDRLASAHHAGNIGVDDTIAPHMFANFKDLVWGEELHRGNFARLWKVTYLGEEFALKEYEREYYSNFKTEAPILVKLQHPNVIHTTCLFEDDKKCGILMELMDEDLKDFLAKNPSLTLLNKLNIMLQVAKGMEYVHSKGIIHRDIKPQNVLVKRQNGGGIQVKVTDFNDAKARLDASNYTKKVGTGVFRAPEVMLGEEEDNIRYTYSADVYSFAMVCFQILSGEQPFQRCNGGSRNIWTKIFAGDRPKLPEDEYSCPPYLRHCVQKWWEGDPKGRPSFTEICRTLRHLIGALVRCPNPLEELPFLRWAENQCQAAQERAKERMESWEGRRNARDWTEKGRKCEYTRVNEIPYEMYVMRMVVEKTIAETDSSISSMQSLPPSLRDQLSLNSSSSPSSIDIHRRHIRSEEQPPAPPDTASQNRSYTSFWYWLCCSEGPTLSTHKVLHES